jgi:hypothetical protein
MSKQKKSLFERMLDAPVENVVLSAPDESLVSLPESSENFVPVVFSTAPIHQPCKCDHTIRSNGFCVHGNNC